MATATSIQKPAQMIITLEDIGDDNTITPAMRRSINKARRELAKGETIKCSTPEEMQRYFDSL
ncbi:MAG: hypothetical protein K6E15_10095 [Prevotella sp.]|nr:hypothetical protein [Prevotella sp.]